MTGQGAVTREAGTGLPRFARNDRSGGGDAYFRVLRAAAPMPNW
jgi:hypothetical protein